MRTSWTSRLFDARPGLYLTVVLIAVIAAALYGFRQTSLFACQAPPNATDSYLAYCESTAFGDYDYGAFWFDLEPDTGRAAAAADVLLLGNSRLQYAFSTDPTDEWFRSASATRYLLGFAYNGNYWFTDPLLRKLQPQASAYVLNVDLFFEPEPTPPAQFVMTDPSAEARYRRKQKLQSVHSVVCSGLPGLCRNQPAIFRFRDSGRWTIVGEGFSGGPVSYDDTIDSALVQNYTTAGRGFVDGLDVPAECQILTVVPTVNTPIASAAEIARSLGRQFVAPKLDGLETFDGSHLDPASAERWSAAFLSEAGPALARCLNAR